jgi:hypothetical protein
MVDGGFIDQSTTLYIYITVAVAKVKSSTTIPGQSGYDEIDGEKRFDVTITKMYTVRCDNYKAVYGKM